MFEAEQFSLDLAGQNLETRLNEQWRRNREAQASQWTPEAMAMSWAGFQNEECWQTLPKYERGRIVQLYQFEQADLEYRRSIWEPWYELIHPDGTSSFYPPKPFQIRPFSRVNVVIDKKEIDDHWKLAQEMAAQLSSDWSQGKPVSIRTYNPLLASSVSLILGKKVSAVLPDEDGDVDMNAIPLSWRLLHAIENEKAA